MILIDSNIIIYLSKGLIEINDLFSNDEVYAISVITYMEVLGYSFALEKEEKFMKDLLALFEIIYIDELIVREVILLKKKYKFKLPDAIICATAILQNATLYTNDIRLKVIEDLQIKSL